uniref:histidine kinase n=1 Tax=Eubacterium cellulosolvens (strain ATCC 43171 / JCM 9499 / 6) TaxID=633697 RepID=I5AU11_EUBC6
MLYRFVYRTGGNNSVAKSMNVVFAMVFLLTMLVLVYIQRKILAPFNRMTGVTEDLARGNLAMPLSQEKSGYFKSFLWSIDMLREKLTDDRTREMALQKEKKTIVLSLAHDIKTPLSAIDLYVKALSENLYDTGEKKEAALKGIEKNADEIKKYVNEIVTASREDFLDLSVKIGEIYLSEVLKPVTKYYADKLNLLSINFSIDVYQDVLLSCDGSRLMEAMQNCMENAIKYGDGREILIGIEEEENCKLITIENSGCNLSAEEEDSIFDSFYRGSNSQGIQGSGLGLYICRELLRAMGGEAYARIGEDLFRVTLVVPMV